MTSKSSQVWLEREFDKDMQNVLYSYYILCKIFKSKIHYKIQIVINHRSAKQKGETFLKNNPSQKS